MTSQAVTSEQFLQQLHAEVTGAEGHGSAGELHQASAGVARAAVGVLATGPRVAPRRQHVGADQVPR